MRAHVIAILLLALANAGRTASQADTLRITWDALQEQLAIHPRLEAARAATRFTAGAAREAGAIPNPSGEVRALRAGPRNGTALSGEREFTLSVPLDWVWTRHTRLGAARSNQERAAAEMELQILELQLEAGQDYWALARDQALVHTLTEQEAHLQELLRAVTTQVRVGESRPLEAARVEVEALQAGLEAAEAKRSLALGREVLALWLPPEEHRLTVVDVNLLELSPLPGAEVLDSARTDHPRLIAARARLRAEQETLSTERLEAWPQVELQGILELADDRRARGAGLALDLPLFNWNRGGVEQARAGVQAAEAGLALEHRQLAKEQAAAWAAWETSREQALSYRERILPRAEEAAEALQGAWRLGSASLFELLDARRTVGNLRRQSIEIFCQAQLDRLRLQLLLGKESN